MSQEEYNVQIIIPEIGDEDAAAFINGKIVLFLSEYKFYEKQRKKSEKKLRKLTEAAAKAKEYLSIYREIYAVGLVDSGPDIIVDFNNEKIIQKNGGVMKLIRYGGRNFNRENELRNKNLEIDVIDENNGEILTNQMREGNYYSQNLKPS